MTIRIRAFAIYRELLGRDVIDLELPDDADPATTMTPRAIFERLFHGRADCARLMASTMFAVNREYVPGDQVLQPGDELALIPPVAGGLGISELANFG